MQTIDEVREHCRFVGKGIEKMVADGYDLRVLGNEELKIFQETETKNRSK